HDIEPDIKSLIKSLRDTADSAQNTLNTVQGLMGNTAPAGTDLPRPMHELTEAARSVRGLADYLDRSPEALIRGRKGDDKGGYLRLPSSYVGWRDARRVQLCTTTRSQKHPRPPGCPYLRARSPFASTGS